MMDREEWKSFVAIRAEDIIVEYLNNQSNYPVINGERAFLDYDTIYEHSKRNIWRNPEHLIDNWEASVQVDGKKFVIDITNRKFVGSYNLLDLLATGTSTYVVPPHKKNMTFWSRYTNQWYFNMQSRKGIGVGFVQAMNTLINEAAEYGLGEAQVEANEM